MFVAAARFLKNCTIIHSVRKRCRTIRVCSIECCLCRGSLRGWGISMLANNKLQYQQRFTWERSSPPSPKRPTKDSFIIYAPSKQIDLLREIWNTLRCLLMPSMPEKSAASHLDEVLSQIVERSCIYRKHLMYLNIYKRTVANYHIAWKCMMIVWHVVWL